MGHRMIAFLSIFLPRHPDYLSPSVSESRLKCIQELKLLQKCLEVVALRIDEDQLNTFICDDFDPIPDDDDDESDGSVEWKNAPAHPSPLKRQEPRGQQQRQHQDPSNGKWEPFANAEVERQVVDSPTAETAGTTSDDDSDAELIQHQHYGFEVHGQILQSTSSPSYVFRLDEYYLDKIASEEVRYELDSEAADSWAQDGDTVGSETSGFGVTYEPARSSLGEVFNRVPIVLTEPQSSPVKKGDLLQPSTNQVENAIKRDEKIHEIQKSHEKQQHDKENGSRMIESPTKRRCEPEVFGAFSDFLDQDEWVSFDYEESSRRLAQFGGIWNGQSI
jgi:hypothetical protein